MHVLRENAENELKNQMRGLLSSLNHNKDFLGELQKGDDWSFVIKAQALIEGQITQSLLAHIGERKLLRIVEAMPLIGDEVSKLALAKDLGLMSAPQRRFVKKMASLRNRLAHRADHACFSFEHYIESLDAERKKDWRVSIPWFAEDQESKQNWAAISVKQPRPTVHLASFILISILATDGVEKDLKRKLNELAMNTAA